MWGFLFISLCINPNVFLFNSHHLKRRISWLTLCCWMLFALFWVLPTHLYSGTMQAFRPSGCLDVMITASIIVFVPKVAQEHPFALCGENGDTCSRHLVVWERRKFDLRSFTSLVSPIRQRCWTEGEISVKLRVTEPDSSFYLTCFSLKVKDIKIHVNCEPYLSWLCLT